MTTDLEKRDFQLISKPYFQDLITETISYCQPSAAREQCPKSGGYVHGPVPTELNVATRMST